MGFSTKLRTLTQKCCDAVSVDGPDSLDHLATINECLDFLSDAVDAGFGVP